MTVTLETLRVDFDALRSRYSRMTGTDIVERENVRKQYALAANTLNVAAKHGLEAAMLYKLSDGAIDPRCAP